MQHLPDLPTSTGPESWILNPKFEKNTLLPLEKSCSWLSCKSLMGRHTRTSLLISAKLLQPLLPISGKLLQSWSDSGATARELAASMKLKCRQQNQGTKNLPPLQAGDAVCMGLPGEQKWDLGPVPLADTSKETDASLGVCQSSCLRTTQKSLQRRLRLKNMHMTRIQWHLLM